VHSIVTVECAGILPCSTADETITHIEKTWQRGQVYLLHAVLLPLARNRKPNTHLSVKTLLEMVRAELGPEIGDELVPMVNGGVQLHKIFGLMHDTCNTANRVAVLMAELRERKARTFHGEAAWDAADPCQKIVHDFLCGNHSRNLLVDRANGLYDAYLETELGEAMRAACVATGRLANPHPKLTLHTLTFTLTLTYTRWACAAGVFGRLFLALDLPVNSSRARTIRQGQRRRIRRFP
jgi:hypothetical protein